MAVAQAKSLDWRTVGVSQRAAFVGRLRHEIVRSRDEVVQVVRSETGKTRAEVLLSDILPTLECLRYIERNAADVLRPRKVPTPFIFFRSSSRVHYRPRGTVLVIAPWNNPFQLSLVPVASALGAGNAVILKPSERTPETGRCIGRLCRRAGLKDDTLQVVPGAGDVAEGLIAARPDMIFFTGGTSNGRAALAAAAQYLIPVVLELGGKDPMLVFADADLDRAVQAAVYGAFAHAGQHCVSVKRLYVEESIYDAFLERLAAEIRSLAATEDWGRAMDDRALAHARQQIREAIEAGARLLVPDAEDRAARTPTLVSHADRSMRLVQEETFAPVLAAIPFRDDDQAVELANESPFGLNASVWSADLARAERVATRLDTGNAYVNGVLVNIGNPHLPFGGVKQSGLGAYHGPEGLRVFCKQTSVMTSRSHQRAEPGWFPHGQAKADAIDELIDLRYGERPWLGRIFGWVRLLRRLSGKGPPND